jgi:PAS domain S-box-containing protein
MTRSAVHHLYADSIVDTVREPLLLLDETLVIVTANASFCRTFGHARADIEGQALYEIGGGEWNVPELRHLLEELLPANTQLQDFEVASHPGAADARTLLLNAKRLEHPDGSVRLILLAFEDVTARRRLERALHLAMTELERSNQELEGFASIASHDLQEPLRKIRAFGERLEAICEGRLPEKGRDYLARMTAAAARMQTLINSVLSLARVSPRAEAWRHIDLGTVVSEVLADLEETLARTGGHVDVGPLPSLPADATEMRQLFQNLIVNALKFRGEAPPLIRITATPRDEGRAGLPAAVRASWQIVVADNGIGFDRKYAERIFKPFERLHGRDAYEGTGIGLALCRRIVQRHGGTISADGAPGAGARLTIHMPALQKDSHDQ